MSLQRFLIISLIFSCKISVAQFTTEIFGKVTDASNKEALGYVNVRLKSSLRATMTDPKGNSRAGFEAELSLNRKDFGITWNRTLDQGGLMLGEEVKIMLAVEAFEEKQ